MEEKNQMIINYINSVRSQLENNSIHIADDSINKVTNQYLNSSKTFEEIKEEIDKLVEQKLEEIRKRQEFLEKMNNMQKRSITDLPIETKGITLNMQQIDLMSIVSSNSRDELSQVLSKITNLSEQEKQQLLLSDKDFEELKREVFNAYQTSLTSYVDTNFSLDGNGKTRELNKRINFVLNNIDMTDIERQNFINIIRTNGINDIPQKINETFSSDFSEKVFSILSRYMPTEKEGIKSTSYESFEKLYKHLGDYQVINVDELAKYSHYVRKDGKFNREDLEKMFDFAKENNMQVRLNTLLFYMDMPDVLESLPKTPDNIGLIKQTLKSYVDDISHFIGEYNSKSISEGNQQTIRTVEVMNELLNRFAMAGETPFAYRGQIDTDEHRVSKSNPNYDNLRAGWLRFLSIEDICEIMQNAKNNMPNVNCMINECTLEDPRKIEPFKRLILDRIHAYEEQHNIKIIDSIGTQMHIDSNVSKENMRDMFEKLGQLGLPVEVTEFDMAISKDFIDSHTPDEVEMLKQQKLNDFCDVIVEMQEKGNIKGVSIWSVNDLQNFVVNKINEKIYIQNLERVKNGLEPLEYVKTLYGGYYDKEMQDRTKGNEFTQSFNYHTHTYRSGHGEYCTDEEMLLSAKKNGIKTLGFSEHIPNPDLVLPDEEHRMMLSEVDGYLLSIEQMKKEHPEMTILSGFEAEYNPMRESFLGEMRNKVDYMILGQHFVEYGMSKTKQKGNPNYPIEYANMVCKAIDSGLFDIVAHPDVFMQFRDSMQTDEDKKMFEENSVLASQMICEKARDMGIPIEINLSSAEDNQILQDGNLAYPHPTFWQVAKEIDGLQVLQGIDAHHQKSFDITQDNEKMISNITDMVKDKMVASNYNPAIARSNNLKLKDAYNKNQSSALSFETHLVTQMSTYIAGKLPDEIVSDELALGMCTGFDSAMESSVLSASEKDKTIVEEISAVSESDLDIQQKKDKLSRKKIAMEETNQVLSNQQRAIQFAKQSVINSVSMGCESKAEVINMTTQITEHNTTKNEEHKSKIETNVSSFQEAKGTQITQEKGSQLIKKPKVNNSSNSSSRGFINLITLTLLVTFVLGVAVGIGYMLYRFMLGG